MPTEPDLVRGDAASSASRRTVRRVKATGAGISHAASRGGVRCATSYIWAGFVEQVFTINGETYPDVPSMELPLGEVRRLEVQSLSPMDHPFHVHGDWMYHCHVIEHAEGGMLGEIEVGEAD